MKSITLDEYREAGEEFWPKYDYVAQNIGEGAKTEDILKVMEAIGGVALKLKLEDKLSGPFGFNKKDKEESSEC